jgi:Sec-independent protein secretion pathway component TatC
MGIAIAILGLLVVGAIVGSTLNFAGVFLGIPLALMFIGALVGKEGLDRQRRIMQMKRFRREARARKVEFTETDKRTVV